MYMQLALRYVATKIVQCRSISFINWRKSQVPNQIPRMMHSESDQGWQILHVCLYLIWFILVMKLNTITRIAAFSLSELTVIFKSLGFWHFWPRRKVLLIRRWRNTQMLVKGWHYSSISCCFLVKLSSAVDSFTLWTIRFNLRLDFSFSSFRREFTMLVIWLSRDSTDTYGLDYMN